MLAEYRIRTLHIGYVVEYRVPSKTDMLYNVPFTIPESYMPLAEFKTLREAREYLDWYTNPPKPIYFDKQGKEIEE